MSPKVTLGFVAALALVAALVVGLDRFNVGKQQSQDSTKNEELTVFQFDDQKVRNFVGRVGDKAVRFEKDGESNWKIADSGEPANRISLSSLVIRMSQLKGTKRVGDTGGDLKTFGVAEPREEATAELDDGSKQTLQIGNTTPVGTGVYGKKAESSDVFVIPNAFASDLERLVNEPKEPPTPTPRPAPTATPEGSGAPEATPTP
jgi:Domain of unknown function (DUF4340)